MPFIILIPGILCMAALLRTGTKRSFLTVVLPVLILLPTDFYLSVKHLPSISFLDAALLSFAVGIFSMDIPRWRFSRMDLWVAIFLLTTAYSRRLPWGAVATLEQLFASFLEGFVPYMAAKLLIEQPGMRVETIKRLVLWMAVACVFSIPQYFLKWNPIVHFWSHAFPGQFPDLPQVRRGFGRVAGPYGTAESAGMMLMIGLSFTFWLIRCQDAVASLGPPLKHVRVLVLILFVTLFMTQSRGPWTGAIISLSIASIGRARRPMRQAILLFSLGLLVGVPLYYVAQDYIGGQITDIGSERQTAQYRAQLIDNYVPYAKLGGAFGQGSVLPIIGGQTSIDNEYLLVWLTQGYVGLASLILIFFEMIVSFARLGIAARSLQERYFLYSALGAVIGLGVCLATVWLGFQTYILFFILAGWSQTIRAEKDDSQGRFGERANHVLPQMLDVRVYT